MLAVLVLFGGLTLFDRVLKRIETEWLRRRFFRRFRYRWTSFALGVLITGVTTSVGFSLGVIVPLYNRNYVKRKEIVPYVLGASIGTFVDTIAIAVLLDFPAGVAIVLSRGRGRSRDGRGAGSILDVLAGRRDRPDPAPHRRHDLAGFLAALVVLPVLLALLPI